MGSRLGVMKIAAKRCGLSLEEYQAKSRAGFKRCIFCEEWMPFERFKADASRWDGLNAGCSECRSARDKEARPILSDIFRLPAGPQRIVRRRGDREQARKRINADIDNGLRPNPNDLHCVLCGHKGSDRRHEYHHALGYDEMHHYDVLPLCSRCHHLEHPRNGR